MPYLPILIFAGLYLVATVLWSLPQLVGVAYLVTSLSCFLMYALDKSAARSGRWRTPETTLLLLGAVGGWPGAVLAQQWLRHKSSKRAFRWKFHVTVILNIVVFSLLAWRFGQAHSL